MQVIIGLGNPGKEYENTLHNAGFNAVNRFALRHNLIWKNSRKFQSQISEGVISDKKIFLLKPMTYMNLSGDAVSAFLSYYNIPLEESMIIMDDIDLPLGKIRIRERGRNAGHKGLGSVIDLLGSEEIPRLRIGIRPEQEYIIGSLKHFVLTKLYGDLKEDFSIVIENIPEILECIIKSGVKTAMNKYNGVNFLEIIK